MGHDSEDAREDRINGAGPRRNLKGGGAVGSVIWQQELGGDWEYYQGPDSVPPSGGATDHGDDG